MWRVLLILAPIIVFFAVDWNSFVKEPTPSPKPFYVTSPTYGVYEHQGHKGSLGEVLDKITEDYPDRDLAIDMYLKYIVQDDTRGVVKEIRKSVTERNGVIWPVGLAPLPKDGDIRAHNCRVLTFSEDDIRSIIAQSPLVRGEVWHYQHNAAPCSHEGVIAFNGKDRKYRYYPTGYMWLEGYDGWLMCYDCSVYPDWIIFDGDYENSTKGAEYKEQFKDLIITPE